MKAVGYVRVSTDRQAELGTSLEAREAEIPAMAPLRAGVLAGVIVDVRGNPPKDVNRPGIQQLLALIATGARSRSFRWRNHWTPAP